MHIHTLLATISTLALVVLAVLAGVYWKNSDMVVIDRTTAPTEGQKYVYTRSHTPEGRILDMKVPGTYNLLGDSESRSRMSSENRMLAQGPDSDVIALADHTGTHFLAVSVMIESSDPYMSESVVTFGLGPDHSENVATMTHGEYYVKNLSPLMITASAGDALQPTITVVDPDIRVHIRDVRWLINVDDDS